MKMRTLVVTAIAVIMVLLIYFLGATPSTPRWDMAMPDVSSDFVQLEQDIRNDEKKHVVKPDNEAHIVWFDGKIKTEYSVLYLHGFSASHTEGNPTHLNFAKTFGCNLYLARLADHGIDTVDHLLNFTVDRLWHTAKKALAISNAIGKKVIIISTSTGGTLALRLAAAYPQDIDALINMSPNIKINNAAAFLLNNPWGLHIARLVEGGKYIEKKPDVDLAKYWYRKYRLEAVVQLQELIESTMTEEIFKQVKQPSLTLYYYQDEQHQDQVVSVDAILQMNELLGTVDSLKKAIPIPKAGTHIIGSYLESKALVSVKEKIDDFAISSIGMMPVIRPSPSSKHSKPGSNLLAY